MTVDQTADGVRIETDAAVHRVHERHVVPGTPSTAFVTRSTDGGSDHVAVLGPAGPRTLEDWPFDASAVDVWAPSYPERVTDWSLAEDADRVVLGGNLDGGLTEAVLADVDEADVTWVEQGDRLADGRLEVTAPDTFDRGRRRLFEPVDAEDRVGTSVDLVTDVGRVSYVGRKAAGVVQSYHGRDVDTVYAVNDPERAGPHALGGEAAERLVGDASTEHVGLNDARERLAVDGEGVDPDEADGDLIDAEEHEGGRGGRG